MQVRLVDLCGDTRDIEIPVTHQPGLIDYDGNIYSYFGANVYRQQPCYRIRRDGILVERGPKGGEVRR